MIIFAFSGRIETFAVVHESRCVRLDPHRINQHYWFGAFQQHACNQATEIGVFFHERNVNSMRAFNSQSHGYEPALDRTELRCQQNLKLKPNFRDVRTGLMFTIASRIGCVIAAHKTS